MEDKERNRVIREMSASEDVYVEKLSKLNHYFVQPLLTKRWKIMKNASVSIFLATIETLCHFHEKFSADLERCLESEGNEDTILIGSLFINYAGLFKLYHPFSRYYEIVMPLLAACEDTDWKEFVEEREQFLGETMSSLAICPIQRVPRYLLLLKELRRKTGPEHADSDHIDQAVKDVQLAVQLVNEAIKAPERALELQSIENEFYGKVQIVKNGRIFLRKATKMVEYMGKMKQCTIHLFNDMLLLSEPSTAGFCQIGKLYLSQCSLDVPMEDDSATECSVCLIAKTSRIVIHFSNENCMMEWSRDLSAAIATIQAASARLKPRESAGHISFDGILAVSSCFICNSEFNMMKRKKKCDDCDNFVCTQCSKMTFDMTDLNTFEKLRVCDVCDMKNRELRSSRSKASEAQLDFSFSKKMDASSLVQELARTESAYLVRLSVLYSTFCVPLLSHNGHRRPQMKDKLALFESNAAMHRSLDAKLGVVLNDIELILTLSAEVLSALSALKGDTSVGIVFRRFAPLFKLYSQYARFYSPAIDMLNRKDHAEEIRLCESSKDVKEYNMTVRSALAMPIERIAVYERFLYEYRARVTDTVEQERIEEALTAIRDCTFYINKAREEEESLEQIRSIEKQFIGNVELVEVGRRLLKSGKLMKYDRRGNASKVTFHLFNDLMIYSKETRVGFRVRRVFDLEQASPKVSTACYANIPNSFSILLYEKAILVQAFSEASKKSWIKALSSLEQHESKLLQLHSSSGSTSFSKSSRNLPHRLVSMGSRKSLFQSGSSTRSLSSDSLGFPSPLRFRRGQNDTLTVNPRNAGAYEIDLTRPPLLQHDTTNKNVCMSCLEKLKWANGRKRHHCRCCGRVVCTKCSGQRVILPYTEGKDVRICDDCYESLGMRCLIPLDDNESPPTVQLRSYAFRCDISETQELQEQDASTLTDSFTSYNKNTSFDMTGMSQ